MDNLIPMQDGLRFDVSNMRTFVRNGGYFTKKALQEYDPQHTSLIAITECEDGKRYIRDGLHRVVAIYLEGRELREDEYFIEHIPYECFQKINRNCGWLTPIDPRTEVRLADFHCFKDQALQIIAEGKDPTEFIFANRHLYCIPRLPKHNKVQTIHN